MPCNVWRVEDKFAVLPLGCVGLLDHWSRERKKGRNGGLGTCADSYDLVRASDARAALSDPWEWQGDRPLQLPDQSHIDFGSHHHLLWSRHHFPHRGWSPHLHRLNICD